MPSFRHRDAAGGQSHAPITAQDGWDTYTGDHVALLDHLGIDRCHLYGQCIGGSLYGPGFVYCVDRAFVSTCATPCVVLVGNDEAHPLPISEELARLLPRCEFICEWKTGAALTTARQRVTEFLGKHTPHA